MDGNIWKPDEANYGKSVLLLDQLSCHKQEIFVSSLRLNGTFVEYIPGSYTCILQKCDVCAMKSLNCGMKKNT